MCIQCPAHAARVFGTRPGLNSHVIKAHGQSHTKTYNSYIRIEFDGSGSAGRAQCTVCGKFYKNYVAAYDHMAFRARLCREQAMAHTVPPLPRNELISQFERYNKQLKIRGKRIDFQV